MFKAATEETRTDLALLRELRRAKGKTQKDVGDALGYQSKSTYAMMEQGQTGIDIETANGIALCLEMTDREVLAVFFTSYA